VTDAARAHTGLGREGLWALAGVVTEKLVALGIALYLPRHLGLDGYGEYALVLSTLAVFQALPDASLEAVLVTRLARAPAPAALAGRGAFVRLGASLAGAALGLAVLLAVTGDRATAGAGAVGALGFAANAASPYRAILRARLALGRHLVLAAAQAGLAIVLLALVVRAEGGVVPVLAATSAASVVGLVLGRALVGPGARWAADAALARAMAADAWPFAGTTLSLVAAQQVVLPALLVRLHGPGAVGLLAGAQKLVEAVGFIPQALMLSVLPALSAAAARPGGAVATAREATRVLVVAIAPAALVLAVHARELLVLALGPALAPAAPVLRALAVVGVLGATGTVIANLLLALGLQRALLRVTIGSALAMVALGVALVPSWGATGAAVAAVVAMASGQGALAVGARTGPDVRPVLAAAARPLAVACGSVAAGAAVGGPVGALVAIVAIYPAALVASRTVTRADVARWRTGEASS